VAGRSPFRLRREESYIGVLVDDLIKQGVDEPYRIFTSRAEHRLALRYDNADQRLQKYGRDLGLVGDSDWERFNQRQGRIANARGLLRGFRLRKADTGYRAAMEMTGSAFGESITLGDLAKRPGITSEAIQKLLPTNATRSLRLCELEAALADDLYAGYIRAQEALIRLLTSHDSTPIPADLDFHALEGLSHEMVERLERTRPQTFGEARSIPGLTPAALSTLYVAASLRT
jgi:tRNA uridine 5-carboxymethylaminomethyl modification enzyme